MNAAGETVPRAYVLPPGRRVRRAREWRLYDQAGDRYVDFWQADGTAFLGHRPRGLGTLAQAEIDRGLWAPVPTAWPARLERALTELADGAGVTGFRVVNGCPEATRAGTDRWLPQAGAARDGSCDVVIPAPGTSVRGVATAAELSPVIAAALVRMTLALATYLRRPDADRRLDLVATLPVPPGYTRHGVWLIPSAPEGTDAPGDPDNAGATEWHQWRGRAAARGILLPPDAATPMVVPGELTRIELERWKGCVDEWPQ